METAYVIILVLLQIFTHIVVCSTTAFLFNHIVITKFLEGFFDCLMCKSRTFFLYITLCKFSYSVFDNIFYGLYCRNLVINQIKAFLKVSVCRKDYSQKIFYKRSIVVRAFI